MKIKIVNEKDEIQKNISIDDILLSSNNPRFTLINSIDDNLIDFFKNEKDFENQNLIFNKLLSSEGDFSDLIKLLNNILEFGFINSGEHIFLIQLTENKYVVAEGNRRMMCLKLILNKFEMPKFHDFSLSNNSNYANHINETINQNEYDEEDNDIEDNYNEVLNILQKIKEKYKISEWKLKIEIINEDEKLWNNIYDKHLTGMRSGMRQWSRSKYFADLLSIFKDGIIEQDKSSHKMKSIFLKIKRDEQTVISDFKEAQYIYSLFYFYRKFNDNKEYVDDFNIKEILDEMIYLNRPSALERNHSFNKIKNLFCTNNINVDSKKFNNDYIRLEFSAFNKRLKIIYNKVKPSLFFSFIVRKWLDNELTTRSFKNETKILKDFEYEVLNNLDFLNKLKEQELEKIDAFSIPLESLESLIKSNEPFYEDTNHKEYINYFKRAQKIREETQKIIKTISKKIDSDVLLDNESPKYIFTILFEQLKWNFSEKNKNKFLNASAVSIRTFFE